MQIKKDELIAGVPAMKLRDAFKRLGGNPWSTAHLAELLDLDLDEAKAAAGRLLSEGWIEIEPNFGKRPLYNCTSRGGQLALASAGRSISRATADRLVKAVIERAAEVNADQAYVFWVDSLSVFGSYLGDGDLLGDVDILVTLSPRHEDPDVQDQAARTFSDDAEAGGRRFPTLLDSLFWPTRAIFMHLKGKSTALSLHPHHDRIATAAEGRLLYQRGG